MGAGAIIDIAVPLIGLALTAAKNNGLLGKADWLKYVDAGLYITQKMHAIIGDVTANPTKYDAMSAAEIKALLTPKTWDEIEAQAQAEIDAGR